MRSAIALAALAVFATASHSFAARSQAACVPRQVAAPASDILAGIVRLPPPQQSAAVSRGRLAKLDFVATGGSMESLHELFVERDGALEFALLASNSGAWRTTLRAEGGAWRDVDTDFGCEREIASAGDELPGRFVDRRRLRGLAAGRWQLRIEAASRTAESNAWIAYAGGGDARLQAWLDGWRVVAMEAPPLLARFDGARALDMRALLSGDGWSRSVALFDDGLHGDGAAGDGVHGAWLPQEALGRVQARVEAEGVDAAGARLARSSHLAFVVEPALCTLSKRVDSRVQPSGALRLGIEARFDAAARRVLAAAEVWGRDAQGSAVPVCWLARILEPEPFGRDAHLRGAMGAHQLPLELDLRWLECAAARGPLELRSVRVQDPDSFVVLAQAESLAIDARVPDATGRPRRAIDPELLQGAQFAASSGTPAGAHAPATPQLLRPGLVLSHGYCSSGAIWPDADFAQPKLAFLDLGANRTHDQFAQRIAQAAQAAGLTSFGFVGHSQGGAAALHLRTYYASALDRSSGPRRIQAVSTPWAGTPLASLGYFACGTNDNMTPSGAAAWLAGIPSWARAEVHCWTVADNGSACNFFTSLLLSDPEDGTVERARGELAGGTLMGHAPGWCHTTGMSFPACYHDHARNAQMDAQAAR